jgi:hypothetical protein
LTLVLEANASPVCLVQCVCWLMCLGARADSRRRMRSDARLRPSVRIKLHAMPGVGLSESHKIASLNNSILAGKLLRVTSALIPDWCDTQPKSMPSDANRLPWLSVHGQHGQRFRIRERQDLHRGTYTAGSIQQGGTRISPPGLTANRTTFAQLQR